MRSEIYLGQRFFEMDSGENPQRIPGKQAGVDVQ